MREDAWSSGPHHLRLANPTRRPCNLRLPAPCSGEVVIPESSGGLTSPGRTSLPGAEASSELHHPGYRWVSGGWDRAMLVSGLKVKM